MRLARRIGLVAVALLMLVAVVLAAWEPLSASRAAPPPARDYDVEIVRDDFGVPHIFGKTDPDVAYGIAYAHAEDDFDTLQQVVAMVRGRLGAMTGSEGAKTDYVFHLLRIRDTVDRDYDAQPEDVRALLDGYAAGLNHYAEQHPEEVQLARLFPVSGRDIAAGFVLRSPFFFGLDTVLGRLSEGEAPPREMADPLPDAPNATPAGPEELEKGSNAFVIAPSRSEDGATHLVSNSHQPWNGGVAWYELVVHSETGWDFAGATFPGAPYPLLGHNKTLGWTNTVNRPDLIDIYRLELDESGEKYRFDGEWRPLEARHVWLPVKVGPFDLPVRQTVWHSLHGPVIRNEDGAFAIRYAGIDQLKMVEQYYRLNRARDFAEWREVMAMQGVPATNFLYADSEGNIAYFYNAMFPLRQEGFDYREVLPGDTARNLWSGTVPWAMVPRIINPASGFIMNANNTPFLAAGRGSELSPADFSPLLGIETDFTNRGIRAVELLEADRSISRAELEAIKYDTAVSRNSWWPQWIAQLLAVDPQGDADLRRAQALIREWDWDQDGEGAADALMTLLLKAGQFKHRRTAPEVEPREALAGAVEHLNTHFGRLDPPMGELLRLRRGDVDLPLDGGFDVLRAAATWDVDDDGRLRVRHGDSFLMFVEWDREGTVHSRSIQPFGAATTRPESPHYADQAPLFVSHRTKPVWFDPAALQGHVERRYRP
ncbi:penicillin acylase family protein [Sphingosinithalassobacter sp. LHW66-3]|uniref:penicillin acylase family protein n=1 Tax=Sphingosinithalassobacter sp. LHW66-3 TaxID=3424718 RepID=UPI003D6B8174